MQRRITDMDTLRCGTVRGGALFRRSTHNLPPCGACGIADHPDGSASFGDYGGGGFFCETEGSTINTTATRKSPRKPNEAERIRARFQKLVLAGRFSDGAPNSFLEMHNRAAKVAMARKGRTT